MFDSGTVCDKDGSVQQPSTPRAGFATVGSEVLQEQENWEQDKTLDFIIATGILY